MKAPLYCVCLALLAAPGLGAASQAPAAGQTNLSGAWELNREASSPPPSGGTGMEDGGRDMHGGHGGPPTGGGHGGWGGGGMGGGRGGYGGGRGAGASGGEGARTDREEMERMRQLAQEVLASPIRLVIDQDGTLVTFTDDEGHVRRYGTTGKSEKHQLTSGTVETKTKWEDGALVIQTEMPRGFKVTRHYALAAAGDAKQLVVTTEIEGGESGKRPPLKSVYDPALAER